MMNRAKRPIVISAGLLIVAFMFFIMGIGTKLPGAKVVTADDYRLGNTALSPCSDVGRGFTFGSPFHVNVYDDCDVTSEDSISSAAASLDTVFWFIIVASPFIWPRIKSSRAS